MFNTEEYKLFLENNCLLCIKYKGLNENNCGINKKIEISIFLKGALFPLKDLKAVPNISKYSCKKFEGKGVTEVKKVGKVIDKIDQLKMF